jgi:ligand-binding SRPBCC domain-containing protein
VLTLRIVTHIRAPVSRCFDLARSIDLHLRSAAGTGEQAVAGVTSGLIGLHQEVTWRARHLGVWQQFTSRITAFAYPDYFRDEMVRGAFRSFVHHHNFRGELGGTTMIDECRLAAPGGPFGWLVERLFLRRYLRSFLMHRSDVIRQVAQSNEWRQYLPAPTKERP